MLALVPLHFLSLFAYTLLRFAIAYIFLKNGTRQIRLYRRSRRDYAALSIGIAATITSLLFFVGFLTQVASLLGIIVSLSLYTQAEQSAERHIAFLLGMCCLILAITGPGIFAIDLPL